VQQDASQLDVILRNQSSGQSVMEFLFQVLALLDGEAELVNLQVAQCWGRDS
jgi:hypothetical protein